MFATKSVNELDKPYSSGTDLIDCGPFASGGVCVPVRGGVWGEAIELRSIAVRVGDVWIEGICAVTLDIGGVVTLRGSCGCSGGDTTCGEPTPCVWVSTPANDRDRGAFVIGVGVNSAVGVTSAGDEADSEPAVAFERIVERRGEGVGAVKFRCCWKKSEVPGVAAWGVVVLAPLYP